MTTSSRGGGGSRRRAEFYAARAQDYRRYANLLLERYAAADPAGALLYEAAKQCINAVANLRGENPATTSSKRRALHDIARGEDDGTAIIRHWEDALKLHVHADRGFVAGLDIEETWDGAQVFIEMMLGIYGRDLDG